MKNIRFLFSALVLLIVVMLLTAPIACAAPTPVTREDAAPFSPASPPPPAPSGAGWSQSKISSENTNISASGSEVTVDRKIVKTGSMTMEVEDITRAQEEITTIAGQLNGYVVSSSKQADDDQPSGFISIRVPADRFNEALQRLRSVAVKVTYENTNSQDITEQYADLEAQLHNFEATEAQYLELLKKADNVKDILEVQRELSNVRENIERVKGRILYLERTSDMSLIEISLKKAKPLGESTWDIPGIFKTAVDGLIVFSQILLGILIWVLVFSPIWIVAIAIIWIIKRKKKTRDTPTGK